MKNERLKDGKLLQFTQTPVSPTSAPQCVTIETQKICYIRIVHKMELLKLECSGSLRLQT